MLLDSRASKALVAMKYWEKPDFRCVTLQLTPLSCWILGHNPLTTHMEAGQEKLSPNDAL